LDAGIIERLSPAEIHEIARWYGRESKRLSLLASERELRQRRGKEIEKEIEEAARHRHHLGTVLLAMIGSGLQPERAIKNLAKSTGESENNLAYALKDYTRRQSREGRDARKIAAIRMAQAGWSNQEIAAKLECHPNTIGRDLKKAVATWSD